jgi:glycosyltransferase involved in cell wall biosynthesis
MLLSLGHEVDYYNISNESAPDPGISDSRFNYIHLYLRKKFSPQTLKVAYKLIKMLMKTHYDYYFVQDEELLALFPLVRTIEKGKIILDVHEMLRGDFLKRILIRTLLSFPKKHRACLTALHSNVEYLKRYFDDVYVLDNLPLYTDFDVCAEMKQKEKLNVIYVGMITEENRQMLKTLDVMHKLIDTGRFTATLIGPIANRTRRDEIERRIKHLQSEHPQDFHYLGPLGRKEVVAYLCHADIMIVLLSFPSECKVASNKFLEAIAAGLVLVTDHVNFSPAVPEHLIVKVDKNDTPDWIADRIVSLYDCQEKILTAKKEIRKWFKNSRLFWESYEYVYKQLFRTN